MRFACYQLFRILLFTLSFLILLPFFYSNKAVVSGDSSDYKLTKQGIHVSLLLQDSETDDDDDPTVHFSHVIPIKDSHTDDYRWTYISYATIASPELPVRNLYRLHSTLLI